MPFLFAACWRLGAVFINLMKYQTPMNEKREMKKSEARTGYIRPSAEVMTARVERGFAGSNVTPAPDQTGATTQQMEGTRWN
jgi:hypothetical protein